MKTLKQFLDEAVDMTAFKKEVPSLAPDLNAYEKQLDRVSAEIEKLQSLGQALRLSFRKLESVRSLPRIHNTDTPDVYTVYVGMENFADPRDLKKDVRTLREWISTLRHRYIK